MSTIAPPTAARPRPAHRALLYRTQDDYAATVAPFLLDGLEAGQSVWVAAPVANLETLRAELGDPPGLRLVDARDWYLRPARTLRAYLAFIDGQLAEGRSGIRLTGELHWPGDDQRLAREWLVYESLLDSLLAGMPVEALCAYNQDLVPAPDLQEVRAIHQGAAGPAATVELPLPDGVGTARFEPLDVVGAVAHVEGRARRAGLAETDVQRLAAAAAEVLWDASERGPGATVISTWEDGRDFCCQIEPGTAPTVDPWSGYLAPERAAAEGWGCGSPASAPTCWRSGRVPAVSPCGCTSGSAARAGRVRALLDQLADPRPGTGEGQLGLVEQVGHLELPRPVATRLQPLDQPAEDLQAAPLGLELRARQRGDVRLGGELPEEQLEQRQAADLGRLAGGLGEPRGQGGPAGGADPVAAAAPPAGLTLLGEQAHARQPVGLGVDLAVGEGPELRDPASDRRLEGVGRRGAVARHQAEHHVGHRQRQATGKVRRYVPLAG